MRVIAGKYRSRRLKGPGTLPIRPTSDRLRETLFNVLGPSIEDSLFIDLFAGTGAVGIEAISRGAREAFFVESNPKAIRLIRDNFSALKISTNVELIETDAVHGLEKIAARRLVANFIFLDPPYAETDQYSEVLEFLDSSHLLAPHGTVIAEHYSKIELLERLDRLECTRQIKQGDAVLSFYRLAAAA
jgi:16S rRNA (guanine(966)-N(2))-methyltransferase RsmD